MSRRPQPSLQCAVRVAAHDCSEFQALFEALQRNNPTVTTVTTEWSTTPEGYGRRLGEALLSNNNSVVSEIDLNLSFFLSVADRQDSMKKNPNIRAFHSYMDTFPLPLLTEYLSLTHTATAMQSLRVEIPDTASQIDQAAQAIAALSGLRTLSLVCTQQFLQRLPACSTRLLRELDVTFIHSSAEASDVAILSSVMSSSKELQCVSINRARLRRESWDLIRSGLQSNPSIAHLKLRQCQLSRDTRSLIVSHMRSSGNASHQHVRILELDYCVISWLSLLRDEINETPLRLVQMLCGSLLQHVTFDFYSYGAQGDFVAEFFALLSRSSSAVRLRSMHLKGHLLWDMRPYLSSNVHLRHFTFTRIQGHWNGDEFAVPQSFLRSLRHNGSLHSVEFKNEDGQLYIPSDYAARFIQACLTRNRELSNVMKSSFSATAASVDEANGRDTTRDHDSSNATRQKRYPALCRVSHQAERMAPNAMLQGLLASSDMLDTMSSSSRVLGKRLTADALEMV